ncbi:NADPH-dependent FMN reductase [Aeromicrobium ginsengisoli]|uniref:NAD(P)H-dependent oxidoreductase n=1 Tax=Aeromicrobium ginsengisoli TaxID=363867 RepID=A0A5M4FBB7_9ACTN|nr:NAD(P)H-dependent oxidoreductase [Aeromicrobium ginsengisoli]KAA1395621.1 NAD(P)H-dependent oxidoreductase [Aeromicrobium ginsengisoli]
MTTHTEPLKIAVIVGSTRPGRNSEAVARWAYDQATTRSDATVDVVDLADHPLPYLDEAVPPIMGMYAHEHTKAWSALIDSYDAFVFVTPEYNHSIPAVLKNAIDFLYAEWNDKAAGLVTYSAQGGGVRAAEHLRSVLAELKVATVRSQVVLTLGDDFRDYTKFAPRQHQEQALASLLDDLVAWGGALRQLRAPAEELPVSAA